MMRHFLNSNRVDTEIHLSGYQMTSNKATFFTELVLYLF